MTRPLPYFEVSQRLSIKEKVGQLFMPAAFINDSEEEVLRLEKLISEHHIGSICFFHSRASAATNFEGKKEVIHNKNSFGRLKELIKRYRAAAKYPLLIAIDAEWGLAMRIENTPQYPYAITLGAMQNQAELVFEVGKQIGLDCRKAGIHWNLSPVVDINLNPENPVIGYRSFGDDKKQVIEYARAYIEGMYSMDVLNSIKHFPGHGDTAVDSHLGLPTIEKSEPELLQNELYPFTELMKKNIDSVMVGHLAVPALSHGKAESASVSKAIITDFLREKLGWSGLIISDALNMHAVSKKFDRKGTVECAAFEAGNDVLCFADHVEEGIRNILEKGKTAQIEKSFERLWKLKERALSSELVDGHLQQDEELMQNLAKESLSLLKGTFSELEEFRNNGFEYLQIGKQNGLFSELLSNRTNNGPNTLLGIFPKQVKPKDNFGLTDTELQLIGQTLKEKNTVLYLFGNPFVLNLIDWQQAKTVVVAYQDFRSFQENAANHFMGKIEAKGKLPVTLKS
ncbi:glycoside hydrolase family 3 protein [Allomuricauda sp. SCSIO 65647]|uniref:glycoside hydrolase family 3 protein n=1 Tax=Allomuricauda sp. SCSIO 65647 TaxID=2908843 RepID=UPI001F1B888A|nr:glycoside hydrolase family 3 protein [Muricauda sp. SCSIO 65647]UJH67875.1 glycoside hydrolase family 3 protein [Muricauda sp. SCSIO 65647]